MLTGIAVVGATGAVGAVTLGCSASAATRRARVRVRRARRARQLDGRLVVEEATPEALAAGGRRPLSSSPSAPRRRASSCRTRSAAARVAIDKSSAYRLEPGVPLVVPEVNGDARARATTASSPNPNCCTIPLTCVLKPLHDAAGLAARARRDLPVGLRRRGAADGAAARPSRRTSTTSRMDWSCGGRRVRRGVEDPRRDAQKILELPDAADQRRPCARAGARRPRGGGLGRVRGAALARASAERRSARRRRVRVVDECRRRRRAPAATTCSSAASARDRGRARTASRSSSPATTSNKGAALNAIQIAELLSTAPASPPEPAGRQWVRPRAAGSDP